MSWVSRSSIGIAAGPQRCRLVIGSWSWTGLVAMLGRFDAELKIAGPPELKQEFTRIS
jgi:hypothetical protein